MNNLNLYAKIESLIGFDEAYDKLYDRYIEVLNQYNIKTLLDVGCGNGNFLLKITDIYEAKGIDLSDEMVKIARSKGVDATNEKLSDLTQSFDAIVAIGDVLNYMKPDELDLFFTDLERVLNASGIFACDLNTLHGFEDVTSGSLVVDRDDEFLSIDAEFFEGMLESEIVYFQREGECFKRQKERIFQYFYDGKDIEKLTDLKLIKTEEIKMFSDEADKVLYIFSKAL